LRARSPKARSANGRGDERALVLTGAGLVSWVLRVLFIVLVPARRLPPRVRRALPHTGPAALAALLATGLARSGSGGGSPVAVLLAL
jgi:branched-subunit amino acid transport protein